MKRSYKIVMQLLYICALIACLLNATAFPSRSFSQKYLASSANVSLCNGKYGACANLLPVTLFYTEKGKNTPTNLFLNQKS